MSFAERLKEARSMLNYSQESLAERIGVSRQTITKWESDTGYPEMVKVFLLATELKISLDWLFEDELKNLGWETLANNVDEVLLAEDNKMPQQRVNNKMVQDAVYKLYNPVVKGAMPTGLNCIDSIDGGLSRGGVYYILGAPEIGKVPFAVNIAVNFLRNNRNVMFVLREHTVQTIMRSLICIDANVNSFIYHDKYTDDENEKIHKAAEFIKQADLIFDDSYDESIDKIYEKCINSKQQLDLVVIDSARLLYTVSDDNIESKKKRIVRIISYIARECRCAVLVLDRINSSVEELLKAHADPEVIVEEFSHGSGLSSSNNLMFMHRDDYYKRIEKYDVPVNIMYNDGYHGKGHKYIDCELNIRTGKITDIKSQSNKSKERKIG